MRYQDDCDDRAAPETPKLNKHAAECDVCGGSENSIRVKREGQLVSPGRLADLCCIRHNSEEVL
jgi:hypothetical protein